MTALRKSAFAAIALLAIIACAAFIFPRGQAITTQTLIEAPPSRVWAVLTDLPAYPAWNPTMRLSGVLTPGAVIENREGPPDAPMIFHPTIAAVVPGRELRWFGGVAVPRLFDANHYFLLRPQGDGTLLIQGEKLHGAALWFMPPLDLAPAADAVNLALKRRAEVH